MGKVFVIDGNDATYQETLPLPDTSAITVIAKGDLVIKGDITRPTMFIIYGNVYFRGSDTQ